ncbi:hypothetical protein ABPG72_009589 [Tetrahymena utriculariae]
MDLILKNCKQNEIILKNQQRKSISRSNSREKSLNTKQKQPAPTQKQAQNNQGSIGTQQKGSKKNLTKNRNLSITTSCEKKQSNNQFSNSKLQQTGNNTCTNSKTASSYPVQQGSMSVKNKTKKTPIGTRNQANSLHQQNSVSKKNNTNSNNINSNNNNTANNLNPHQLSNSLTPGLRGEQYHNFSSFFSSQSTKNNINNNLLNNSIQGNQQPQKNSDKITLFLQHLQNSDSPMKQIQQIQDKLQSYHHSNNNVGALHQSINNNKILNQQNLNSSLTNQTMNLNNSYCHNNLDNQQQMLQQGLIPRQRINSNDCVFNINQSSITGGMQSEQYDPYRASFSHQESLQLNDQVSSQQNQKGVAQINLKFNQLSKSIKNASPLKNNFPTKKNVFSLHSSTSSVDPQKCLLNQFEEQFTPSSQMVQQNKFIDLSGANIQISDIILDKKMNINELNSSNDKLNILSLKEIPFQMKGNSHQQKQFYSETYDASNDACDEMIAASMPANCKLSDDYLRTPKQNIFSEISKSQQLPYQHTPITNNQIKQSQMNNQKQEEKNRSKSVVDQEYLQLDAPSANQQNQEKMFQKRRALTIADDSYEVLNNDNNKSFEDSMQVNHTYHGDNNSVQLNKVSRKLLIPKIKNFDQMIEEKNQQMDYEIPPHVYNETFQGEEYTSSQTTSDIRSETYDSLNQTQNIDNNLNQDSISIHPTLKSNPMQGYRNIMKAMEISGKDNDVEMRALKITIRKLQYRDAVLRQKIAKMSTQSQEQLQTIQKLDAENSELINQVNAYAEQHEIHEQQISQLQYEMQQFQQQFQHLSSEGLNKSSDQTLKDSYEQAIEALRQKLVDYEQTVYELRDQVSEYEKNEENLKIQINEREEEIQKQQYEFLEKLAEFQEENIRINNQVKAQQEQTQKNDERQALNKQIADLNSENEKLYDQITSLLKENEQYKQQREVVSNVNDLSLKSLKLLDDNSKLIEENRALLANILILNKDNQQLKEGLQSVQQQIQQQQENIIKRAEEKAYKKLVEDSQNTIKEMKQINQELLFNISNLELQNKELSTRCSTLEIKLNSQNESIKQYSNNQSKEQSPKEKSLIEKITNLQKEIVAEKEKSESLEKKIVQMSQKNSLNQSVQSKQEYQCEEINRIRVENDELRKELEDQYKEKECLEEVLKNYLLQRELEKLKMNGEQNTLKDQEQDEDIAEVFQSDSKINAFLNSQQRTNMDLNSQLLNYFSNSNQNKPSSAIQNQAENYNLYKRNSNCTITNGNNTNYQISITECSQLSLLEEDNGNRINEDEEMDPNDELKQNFKRNAFNGGIENQQMQDQQDISNIQHVVSTNTNINNNNFNNNNNTVNSNNQLKKSSASSSHFLREIDSNIQILINNNSNNTLLNNIQHLLNTSSSSNLLSKENNINYNSNNNTNNQINNNPNLHHPYQNISISPSSSKLHQNYQQAQVLQNNQPQSNLPHQNPSTKQGTYLLNQKSKENDNPYSNNSYPIINNSLLTQQNANQMFYQQKGISEKVSYQQQCANQVKHMQNKENQFIKSQH